MAKKTNNEVIPPAAVFQRIVRMVIPVPHRELSDKIETSQGLEKTVKSLYNDYVSGTLDPRQLGGGSYDPDGSDELDPFNTSGLTFEEATQIEDAGRNAAQEVRRVRSVADHPIESSKPERKEEPHEGGDHD